MLFDNKYPYTDNHELNLDWIISTINKLDTDLSGIEERATQKAIAGAKEYVDGELIPLRASISSLAVDVSNLRAYVNEKVADLDARYLAFTQLVNANLDLMDGRITALRNELITSIEAVNNRTDTVIEQNNQYIFSRFGEYISTTIKVTNFFTGEQVTLQEMFNYLANLHVTDGITYDEIVVRNKTVQDMINYNQDITDLVLHGNTIIV